EGGIREPLSIRWPEVVKPGTRVDSAITSPDFYPTLLSAAGLPLLPSQHQDGVDLSALLTGGSVNRGPVFFHYPHYSNQGGRPASAIRDGEWKLVYDWESQDCELYRLSTDIGETNDVAPRHPEVTFRLSERLLEWV